MKAGEIHILLHHHITPDPWPWPSTFYRATLAKFRESGLLAADNQVTTKGRGYVDQLKMVTA